MQSYKLTILLATWLITLTGCALFNKKEEVTLRIHEQAHAAMPESYAMKIPVPKDKSIMTVHPVATLTEKDIISVARYETAFGSSLLIRFDPDGLIKLDELTMRLRGQSIYLFINGRVIGTWLVDQRLSKGQLLIETDLTVDEANKIITDLNTLAKKLQNPNYW